MKILCQNKINVIFLIVLFLFYAHAKSFGDEKLVPYTTPVGTIFLSTVDFPFLLSNNPQPEIVSSNSHILAIRFGLLKSIDENMEQFVATTTIPLIPKTKYGWIMFLKSDLATITCKEELELPRMPLSWGNTVNDSQAELSKDQRIATIIRELPVTDNPYVNFWTVVFGDPVGEHRLRLFLNGEKLQEFVFSVVEPSIQVSSSTTSPN